MLDAPYSSYAQPIYKLEATPTPTQVPGTPTPLVTATEPPLPTVPPPPTKPYREYAPLWIDTASTATATPTATATISPDATPTLFVTSTMPPLPSPPWVTEQPQPVRTGEPG